MELNHLQKIYYAYKALKRAAVTKSREKKSKHKHKQKFTKTIKE